MTINEYNFILLEIFILHTMKRLEDDIIRAVLWSCKVRDTEACRPV